MPSSDNPPPYRNTRLNSATSIPTRASSWDELDARGTQSVSDDDAVFNEDPLRPQSPRKTRNGQRAATYAFQSTDVPLANTSRPRRRTDVDSGGLYGSRIPSEQFQPEFEDFTKDGTTVDWYLEGPGKRVGYDDLTAIDWIFEYAKERQRLRMLYSTTRGILGQLKRILDASQIWIVLILTGLATGAIAAAIDVASDWLADLKTGYCQTGEGGGAFYLNKGFCCWGHDEYARCQGWRQWNTAIGISSAAGGWVLRYVFFILFSVIFALCASFLVIRYSLYAKQSGIPEIKTVLGGFVMRHFMGPWVLLIKSLGLCLSVASGLWVGKEGPLVHVACCCANFFLQPFQVLNENEARKREILSAAAAAGISVAFGAPVGGVLFSLEQLSYYFPDKTMWQSFVCAMIAAVTLQIFNPFRSGKLVLYQVTYSTGWHAFELVPFMLLGILGGVFGGLFIRLNMRIARWRKNNTLLVNPLLQVLVVALITAIVNFPNKFMRAQSTELVATLFSECSEMTDEQLGLCGREPTPVVLLRLIGAAVMGFFLMSATFGLQIPSGVILPSLAVGALYGRAVGLVMRSWNQTFPDFFIFSTCEPDVPCVTAGTYAIIGAASALGGATRMTISIVVITFELTGALTYVLPIMVSVMLAKWVGDAFGTKGIYESWIQFNEYPFLDNRDDAAAAAVPDVSSSSVMTRIDDVVVLPAAGHSITSLEELLQTYRYRGFPIVSSVKDPLLLGYISRTELAFALSSARGSPRLLPADAPAFFSNQSVAPSTSLDLRPWMDQTPITLAVSTSLQMTVNLFLKLGLRYLLFVERGRLRGLLTKKDVWLLVNQGEAEGVGKHRVRDLGTLTTEEVGSGESAGLLGQQEEGLVDDGRDSVRIG